MEGRWEGKGLAVFYLELALDMLHLIVYCIFFAAVFSTYGIPIHLVRRAGQGLGRGWAGAGAGGVSIGQPASPLATRSALPLRWACSGGAAGSPAANEQHGRRLSATPLPPPTPTPVYPLFPARFATST
jgi:hypothetical protein